MDTERRHIMARFIAPVALENIVTIIIGMVFSALTGSISSSSLAAISSANLVNSFYLSLFCLLSVGTAVLVARLVGAGDRAEAARTIEQSIFMTVCMGLILTVFTITCAHPLMKIIMPGADAQLLDEAADYFRVIGIGIPGLLLYTMLMSVIRAGGNSRAPFMMMTIINLTQLFFAWLFIKAVHLGIWGAAISNVISRTLGGIIALVSVIRSHSSFIIEPRRIFRPNGAIIRRIARLGIPASLDSCFMQSGYIIANSLVVGLGTMQASIYQISTSLQSFANLPLGICSATATTFVGQKLGAGDNRGAKKLGYMILLCGLPVILVLYLIMAALGTPLAGLYSTDGEVISGAAGLMWVLIGFSVPGLSINVVDPCLRAGGDAKFVLFYTLFGVWAVRLPLSWLLGYKLGMGVSGIIWANVISLIVRAAAGHMRYASGKWMHKKV